MVADSMSRSSPFLAGAYRMPLAAKSLGALDGAAGVALPLGWLSGPSPHHLLLFRPVEAAAREGPGLLGSGGGVGPLPVGDPPLPLRELVFGAIRLTRIAAEQSVLAGLHDSLLLFHRQGERIR
jgi:hypothetical protein